MFIKLTATLTFAVFASISVANASGVEEFPTSDNQAARKRINEFLDPGTDRIGVVSELRKLEVSGLPAIHLLLDVSVQRLSENPSPGVRKRVRALLSAAAEIARDSSDEINVKLIAGISEQLEQLLDRFRARSGYQESLIKIYDSLKLWSPKDFWFFLQFSRNTGILMEHQNRIRKLIPALSDEQLDQFAERLRSIRPYNPVQLSLLLDTGRMTERELTMFFKVAAQSKVERWQADFDEPPSAAHGREKVARAVAPTLTKLSESLKQENAAVVSAFNKARKSAAQGPLLEAEIRQAFFSQLLSDVIKTPGTPPIANLPDYKVDDNVILVDFKYQPRCEDEVN